MGGNGNGGDDSEGDADEQAGPFDVGESGAITRASKRMPSSSFAIPELSTSKPKKNKKKTTKTTTIETTTTTTKKKITTKVVREDAASSHDDGPRRSRRNRTEVILRL